MSTSENGTRHLTSAMRCHAVNTGIV